MDYVGAVLLGAITALLIAILLELGRIRLSLTSRSDLTHPSPEATEGHHMVTVNVGAVGSPESNLVKVAQAPLPVEPPSLPSTISEEVVPEVAPKSRPSVLSASSKPGSGSPGAIKCPHCDAENFSFRTECFICGKSL